MTVSRRELITWLAVVVTPRAAPLGGLSCADGMKMMPPSGYFTAQERSALGALANAVLPPDDLPGGADLGAVAYVERLLTALDDGKVFAGGPFSGRQPFADGSKPQNDFQNFVELDRVARKIWEARTAELRMQVKEGLTNAIASAPGPGPIDKLTQDQIVDWFRSQPMAFRDLLVDLVSQAAFGAPEYGGNANLGGWKIAHFEGDSQPLGYSIWDGQKYKERPEAPMSGPNPSDPEPMDDEVRNVIRKVIQVLGGKEFP